MIGRGDEGTSETAPTILQTADGSTPGVTPGLSTSGAIPPEVAASAADPRRRIGRYVLLHELGRGGMGVVWRAYDTALLRPVAFKTFLERPGDEELRRFAVEVKSTARLQHPNIVGVLDVGEHQGRSWYVMDLVEGESLEALLRRGLPPPTRVAEIVRDVARALEHAHGRGIVHRDVKPDNILLDREGRVRLTDLGLARDVATTQKLTQTGQLLGTPAYMAPEQAGGEGPVGPLADVYALGGVLYRALTGSPPFSAPSVFALLKLLLFDPPTPIRQLNPDAPPELERLATRCLSKAPASRPPSAAAVAEDLELFLKAQRRGRTRRAGSAPPSRVLWGSMTAVALVGAALLFVAALVLATFATWRPGEAPAAPMDQRVAEVAPPPPAPDDTPALPPEVAAADAIPVASLRARWDFMGPDPWRDEVSGRRARGERVELAADGLTFSGAGGGLVLSPDLVDELQAGAVALTLRRDRADELCRVLAHLDPGRGCPLGIEVRPNGLARLWVDPAELFSGDPIDVGRFHRLVFAWGPGGCRIAIDGTIVARSPAAARVTTAPRLELGRDPNNPGRTGSHMTLKSLEVHEGDLDDATLRGL